MVVERIYNENLDEELLFTTHKSGLKVYIFPKKGFSKYYAVYGTRYGSLDRTFTVPGEAEPTTVPDGIAHYLEHKLFEQEDGSDAFELFAKTGASSNAFTSFNRTAYLYTCTDKFYENLDILLGFVNHPHFTKENVAKEQGIIGQEIKMYDDNPGWRVFFNALHAMYHNNPVKIDIAGTVESIAKITPEILYKCYKTFYNPSNMILVLVGDIDINTVMEYVDKHLGDVKPIGEIERPKTDEPYERVQEFITQSLAVSRPLFQIGFKEAEVGIYGVELQRKRTIMDILLTVLFGRSSKFYMDLYEEGLIDKNFGSECELEVQYGFTLIEGESDEPEVVYDRVKKYLAKVKEEGISLDAIERAKKLLIGDDIRLYNNVEDMGNEFLGDLLDRIPPFDYAEIVKSITYDELIERLKEHFDTDNCVLSVVKPNE